MAHCLKQGPIVLTIANQETNDPTYADAWTCSHNPVYATHRNPIMSLSGKLHWIFKTHMYYPNCPNIFPHAMLSVTMLYLTVLTFVSITNAHFPFPSPKSDNFRDRLAIRQAALPCSIDCKTVLDAEARCGNTRDPWCGCQDILNSTKCLDCLTRTGTKLQGYVDAQLFSVSMAFCKCQTPSCGAYLTDLFRCSAELSCICPISNKYGPDCFPCLKSTGDNITAITAVEDKCQTFTPIPNVTSAARSTFVLTGTYILSAFGILLGGFVAR
jgi:hypothetical protein